MKLEIDCHFEPDIVWLGEINRQTLRLERQLSVFPASTTQLNCALWHGVDSRFGITLTLHVAGRKLLSRAEDRSPVVATRRAFDDLNERVAELTEQFRTQEYWRRTSHNRADRADSLRLHTAKTVGDVGECIDRNLTELYNFARREIASSQAKGDLHAGDLAPEEILDEVLIRALEGFSSKPAELSVRAWLFQLALDTIKYKKHEIGKHRRTIMCLAENSDGLTRDGEVVSKDEIYDFYQPETEILLKDLIPDGCLPTREESVAQREYQQYINRALAQLPNRWREAFVLYSIESLNLEEVARVTRESVDATRRSVEMAREYLRACLADAGVKPPRAKLRKEATA